MAPWTTMTGSIAFIQTIRSSNFFSGMIGHLHGVRIVPGTFISTHTYNKLGFSIYERPLSEISAWRTEDVSIVKYDCNGRP